jgi:hypothetical protein
MTLRCIGADTNAIFEFKLNNETWKNPIDSSFSVTALLSTQKEMLFFIQFLRSNQSIASVSIFQSVFSEHLYIELSEFSAIRKLCIQAYNTISISLPPQLEYLETDLFNLPLPCLLPSTVTTFCDPGTNHGFMFKEKIFPFLKNNPHLTHATFNISTSTDEKNLFNAILSRGLPLEFLCINNTICLPDSIRIANRFVRALQCFLSPDLYGLQVDGPTILRKLIDNGSPIFQNMTGWTRNLHELQFGFSFSGGVDLGSNRAFFSLHTKLQKIVYAYSVGFDCNAILDGVAFFPPCLVGEILCVKNFRVLKYIEESCKRREEIAYSTQKDNFLVRFCRKVSWLPRLHNSFPSNAQQAFHMLALGLTRLKKYHELVVDTREKEALVHVDPACIEWMLEDFFPLHSA